MPCLTGVSGVLSGSMADPTTEITVFISLTGPGRTDGAGVIVSRGPSCVGVRIHGPRQSTPALHILYACTLVLCLTWLVLAGKRLCQSHNV